jgi:hypothetical protein
MRGGEVETLRSTAKGEQIPTPSDESLSIAVKGGSHPRFVVASRAAILSNAQHGGAAIVQTICKPKM